MQCKLKLLFVKSAAPQLTPRKNIPYQDGLSLNDKYSLWLPALVENLILCTIVISCLWLLAFWNVANRGLCTHCAITCSTYVCDSGTHQFCQSWS